MFILYSSYGLVHTLLNIFSMIVAPSSIKYASVVF